jgi:Flp pilus assembly protein TadD
MAEGMLADHQRNWAAADAAYARAETLTTNPANVLNNWGVSLMSRGDFVSAASTFERALSFNARLFNAKNNLAIARGLQGNFQLPIVPMTETEKAVILNNLGLIAMRKNEKRIAKGLFAAAVDVHPQHYPEAADRLAALEAVVEN